jgi:subtilisin family serine protease
MFGSQTPKWRGSRRQGRSPSKSKLGNAGSRGERTRARFSVEALETRIALSAVPGDPGLPRFVPGQVLVEYQAGIPETQAAAVRDRFQATVLENVTTPPMQAAGLGRLELLQLPPGLTVERATGLLQSDPAVRFAEPNWIYQTVASSNDPYFTNGSLWGMYGDASTPRNRFGSQAAEAWAVGYTGSSQVYVGIIDQGVMTTHEDLAANLWNNPFDPPDGIDNDGNGFVDDVFGWDFLNDDNTVYDGPGDFHGTHVAGTVGAAGGNGIGVVGVNWNVTLISGKFIGTLGGNTVNAIRAIDYFTDLKTRHGLNVVATNNSWGGGGFSQALFDAIERANAAGILFIAAAGNGGADGIGDNNDVTPFYPASYPNANIISVAAISSSGQLARFSNYGLNSVHIAAPGVRITSTYPLGSGASGYASLSGTSMAAPHVTGAAALYASVNPGATAAQIKQAILSSAMPTRSVSGKVVTGGRLDISRMLGLATAATSASGSRFGTAGSVGSLTAIDSDVFLVTMVDLEHVDPFSPKTRSRLTDAGISVPGLL